MVSHVRRTSLHNIAEELRCHILSFLESYNDIVCCALTCKMIYRTVKSSVRLQYLIALYAQKLIPIHSCPPTVTEVDCVHILRAKANAWNTFKLRVMKRFRINESWMHPKSITHHELHLSENYPRPNTNTLPSVSKVVNIKTDTPEIVFTPSWTQNKGILHLTHGVPICTSYIDAAQDLMVIVNVSSGNLWYFNYRIHFKTISTSEKHPLAPGPGPTVVLGYQDARYDEQSCRTLVTVFGNRLAFYRRITYFKLEQQHRCISWSLHVWNWHKKAYRDDVGVFVTGDYASHTDLDEIRFLTKEKLLALTSFGHIELYDIKDMSMSPQLQARFVLPDSVSQFRYPSDFHSASTCARITTTDERWIWTTNPADRVISVVTSDKTNLIISARIFFMDIPSTWFDATSVDGRSVPWLLWGPQYSRSFPRKTLAFGIGGSRVIWAVPIPNSKTDKLFRLHMTDFNPITVARGIGKVFRGPTLFKSSRGSPTVTTCLPYVEVVNQRIFKASVCKIVLNEDKLVVYTKKYEFGDDVMNVEIFDM